MPLKSPGGSQADSQSFSESSSDSEPVSDVCADLKGTISGPIAEREDISTESLQDRTINCLPVEILSMIFVLVKKAIMPPTLEGDFECVPTPTFHQPSLSPPLLVGAVCKRWRDITLGMPQLWTDIIINPLKRADGQLAMVNEWARRSDSRPLDVGIYLREYSSLAPEKTTLDDFGGVVSVLRSLSDRWNNITLDVPFSFRNLLLNNLEETPLLGSLVLAGALKDIEPFKLQHPLRPKRLISSYISGMDVPFEWDRLVFLELANADDGEVLHIIRHAPNLTHCNAGGLDNYYSGHFPIPTTPITSHSLIFLQTKCDIIGHLTLPSLLYLDYDSKLHDSDDCFDSVSKFVERSSPPLGDFNLQSYVDLEGPFPPFERLACITSLDINTGHASLAEVDSFINTLSRSFADQVLPRLKSFSFITSTLSTSSWSSLSRIFPKHSPKDPAAAADFRRPLSWVYVRVRDDDEVVIDKETFLRLSEVKKSGVDLYIMNRRFEDVFSDMASVQDRAPPVSTSNPRNLIE